MSRNLVRECVDLQLDKSQRKRFQKGDAVEVLSGNYRGTIGKVARGPTRSDLDALLVRVRASPCDTIIRIATVDVRPAPSGAVTLGAKK